HAEKACRAVGEVDLPPGTEGSAIGDRDQNRSPVPQVRDPNLRSEGKGPVSSGQLLRIETFAACREPAGELLPVPGGVTDLGRNGRIRRDGPAPNEEGER